MMIDFLVLAVATGIGLYMAANIGANDLANAMGTSVGSGAINWGKIISIAISWIISSAAGALIAGGSPVRVRQEFLYAR